jgi:hypothetical protein
MAVVADAVPIKVYVRIGGVHHTTGAYFDLRHELYPPSTLYCPMTGHMQ